MDKQPSWSTEHRNVVPARLARGSQKGGVLSFDEQLSSKPVSDWRETCTVLSLMGVGLGAGHYAYNQGLLIHAEVALAELKGALFGLRLPGMGLTPQEALKDVEYYLEEVQDDWRRVWAWLHGRTSLQQLHPGYPVHERLVFDATGLLDARDTLWGAVPGPRGCQAGARAQEAAAMLVGWLEPIMDKCFRLWKTPEPYCKVEQVQGLRSRLADGGTVV